MQASIGGKTLDTSKIEKPKFNLFNFQKQAPIATIGGVGITQKTPVQASITPTRQVTPVSNTPTQKPIQGRGATNLFIDEQEALQKMLDAGLDENKAKEVITERRKSLLSEISQEESVALTKMIQAGLDSEKAVELVKQNRNQNLPAWKKVAKFGFDATVGSLGMVSEQVGNVGGFLGAEGMQETGGEIRDITTRTTGDSLGAKTGEFITGAGEILATSPAKIPATLLGRIGQGAVVGGYQGATMPILEKGNEVTAGDITQGGLVGGVVGAVAVPVFEKGLKAVEKGIQKGVKYGTAGYQGGITGLGKSIGRDVKAGVSKIPSTKTAVTRDIPKAIVKRDLGFTPTERAKIESITGKTEAQYILEKGLAGKGKEELAEIFAKQSDDMYRGISDKLKTVNVKVKSKEATEALQDMLDQFSSNPKYARAYAKDIEGIENMLKRGEYTLDELNNIRRAYDKVNTGMFTAKGTVRSGLDAEIDAKVRRGINETLQKEAKKYNIDVKEMNKELRVGIEMKDALLRRLSQEERNNFIGLQDLGVSAILSGGNPITAVATIGAKKYGEKIAPGLSQKLYNLNKKADVSSRMSRGNPITPRPKSSRFGFADSARDNMAKPPVKSTQKLLSAGTTPKSPIITPQTLDKARILESKTELSKAKIVNPQKGTKSLDNKGGYINPSAIVDDITKAIKTLTPKNITQLSVQIASKLKVSVSKVQAILKEYVQKYGAELKNKAGDLFDDLADRLGVRAKLLAGENAKFAPTNLEKAKMMDKLGNKADDIWSKTGWEKGTDGKWRFEIDDSKAKLTIPKDYFDGLEEYKNVDPKGYQAFKRLSNMDSFSMSEIQKKRLTELQKKIGIFDDNKLSTYLDHKDLYENYPKLKDTKIEVGIGIDGRAFFNPIENKIVFNKVLLKNKDELKSVLLHEVQHVIQETEGFAKGGSYEIGAKIAKGIEKQIENINEKLSEYAKNNQIEYYDASMSEKLQLVKELRNVQDEYGNIGVEGYKKLAGETEARNIQTRLLKPTKLRPELTEDIPRSKQIIRKDGGTAMSLKIDAPKELIEEAKKYKSAEEFIENIKNTKEGGKKIKNLYSTGIVPSKKITFVKDQEYLDEKLVSKIMKDIQDGKKIEPIILEPNRLTSLGNFKIVDGNHRLIAAQRLGVDIPVLVENPKYRRLQGFRAGEIEPKMGLDLLESEKGYNTISEYLTTLKQIWKQANK